MIKINNTVDHKEMFWIQIKQKLGDRAAKILILFHLYHTQQKNFDH